MPRFIDPGVPGSHDVIGKISGTIGRRIDAADEPGEYGLPPRRKEPLEKLSGCIPVEIVDPEQSIGNAQELIERKGGLDSSARGNRASRQQTDAAQQ